MNDARASSNIFISHTHEDKNLADTFERMVTELFSGYVTVSYSSNPELGPKHGEKWLQWIEKQVQMSDRPHAGNSANAAIVAGEELSVVRKKLEGILAFNPTPEDLHSIEKGYAGFKRHFKSQKPD
jgi:hypothetical protein